MVATSEFLMAAGLAFIFCFPVHRLLTRWRVIDQPNARSSHIRPVVRGGGIAVLAAAVVTGASALNRPYAAAVLPVALAGLVLAAVSFADDLKSLAPAVRFAVQAGAAVAALVALRPFGDVAAPNMLNAAMAFFLFLWITGYTNAFNFMDGVNGLAAAQAAITGIGTAAVAYAAGGRLTHPAVVCSLALAGAAAGFLPHNFPRARMFLGDVGSAPVGFFLAVFAVWLARDLGWWLLGAFGLLHANFVLDTGFTLARRIWKRERWTESHREHFYQRLVRTGRSHVFVTGWEAALQAVVLIVVVVSVKIGWPARICAAGFVCVLWGVFFAWAEARYRRP